MIDIVSTRVGSDSKLPCIEGWKISKEFSIEKTKIGDICKGSNIKISDCELGLFGKKKNRRDMTGGFNGEIVEKLLKQVDTEKKISCEELWEFASKNNLSLLKAASVADEAGVKVIDCCFGCF